MVKIPAGDRHLLKATLLVALVISVAKFLEGV